jgi:hypothetical protein
MAIGNLKDGDLRFTRGMDSISDPITLGAESYTFAVNMLNRGGAMQTRPGLVPRVLLPKGKLQGLSVFQPRRGVPTLVSFVDGVAHATNFPYRDYRVVGGATMSPVADKVFTASTTKAVERNFDNSIKLVAPYSVLMVQDGLSAAAYFDGRIMARPTGDYRTPMGTSMAWAGARLWVARREKLFASDIADPLSFYEQAFNTLGGLSYFLLPGACTGLSPIPGTNTAVKTPLIAFTNDTTTMFLANILSRDLWATTPDFQSPMFDSLGCVAPRSIVALNGMLWWFSAFGQTRLDAAAASYVSTKIDYLDREMARSAKSLSGNLSGIACAGFENFMLSSVPFASKKNVHTWVYDANTIKTLNEEFPAAWASIWTGINPVQWVSVRTDGNARLFCVSADADGNNRIYEAFTGERRDGGCDIPWRFESRAYSAGGSNRKHFRFMEYALSEIEGQVDINISWAGANRGRWKSIATPTFNAQEGNIDATRTYEADDQIYGLKKQSRHARTQDVRDMAEDSLTSAGVEGDIYLVEVEKEPVDTAFQVAFEGSGPCAIRALRLFMDAEKDPDGGMQDNLESDDHFVRVDGGAAKSEVDLRVDPESFTATATETAIIGNLSATGTATIVSTISQSDADKRASQVARQRAENRVRRDSEPYVGGSLV